MHTSRRFLDDVIARRFDDVWATFPRIAAGADPEAVHDARVASRRLRAAMDVASSISGDRQFCRMHRLARAITRELGALRDREVLLAAFSDITTDADHSELRVLDHLVTRLAFERDQHSSAAILFIEECDRKGLRSKCAARFRIRRGSVLLDGDLRRLARQTIQTRTAILYGRAATVSVPHAISEHHDLRIAAKQLRYSLELFAPALAHDVADTIVVVRDLQAALGDLHDTDVRIDLLAAELSQPSDPAEGASELEHGARRLLDRQWRLRAEQHQEMVRRWRGANANGLRETLVRLSARTIEQSDPREEDA